MPVTETFFGFIETTNDALLVFEACRRGILPKISRRLQDRERDLIRSGSVFIFDDKESGIKRWTDGLVWSPSRILGNFLVYRELDGRDSMNDRTYTRSLLFGTSHESSCSSCMSYPADFQTSTRNEGQQVYTTSNSQDNINNGMSSEKRNRERDLVGSLTDSYKFRKSGLIKKTISIHLNGSTQHMISYYTKNDVLKGILFTPSSVTELSCLHITSELLLRQSFRIPPSVEFAELMLKKPSLPSPSSANVGLAISSNCHKRNKPHSQHNFEFTPPSPNDINQKQQNEYDSHNILHFGCSRKRHELENYSVKNEYTNASNKHSKTSISNNVNGKMARTPTFSTHSSVSHTTSTEFDIPPIDTVWHNYDKIENKNDGKMAKKTTEDTADKDYASGFANFRIPSTINERKAECNSLYEAKDILYQNISSLQPFPVTQHCPTFVAVANNNCPENINHSSTGSFSLSSFTNTDDGNKEVLYSNVSSDVHRSFSSSPTTATESNSPPPYQARCQFDVSPFNFKDSNDRQQLLPKSLSPSLPSPSSLIWTNGNNDTKRSANPFSISSGNHSPYDQNRFASSNVTCEYSSSTAVTIKNNNKCSDMRSSKNKNSSTVHLNFKALPPLEPSTTIHDGYHTFLSPFMNSIPNNRVKDDSRKQKHRYENHCSNSEERSSPQNTFYEQPLSFSSASRNNGSSDTESSPVSNSYDANDAIHNETTQIASSFKNSNSFMPIRPLEYHKNFYADTAAVPANYYN